MRRAPYNGPAPWAQQLDIEWGVKNQVLCKANEALQLRADQGYALRQVIAHSALLIAEAIAKHRA